MGIYSYSNEAHWHLDEDNYSETVLNFTPCNVFENGMIENTATSPEGQ